MTSFKKITMTLAAAALPLMVAGTAFADYRGPTLDQVNAAHYQRMSEHSQRMQDEQAVDNSRYTGAQLAAANARRSAEDKRWREQETQRLQREQDQVRQAIAAAERGNDRRGHDERDRMRWDDRQDERRDDWRNDRRVGDNRDYGRARVSRVSDEPCEDDVRPAMRPKQDLLRPAPRPRTARTTFHVSSPVLSFYVR